MNEWTAIAKALAAILAVGVTLLFAVIALASDDWRNGR